MRSCSLPALFAAMAQSGHSKLTRPRTSKWLEAPGGEPALALVEQRTDSFFLQSRRGCRGQLVTLSTTPAITVPRLGRVCALGPGLGFVFAHQQSDSAHIAIPAGVSQLDRNVKAGDIRAIFLQSRLLDVSDGVHMLMQSTCVANSENDLAGAQQLPWSDKII